LPSRRAGAAWRRWLPAQPYALATVAVAVLVAVFAGVQLGNSAISDINPIHYRGAVVHPRDRGAAVPEHQARARPPAYAALYGWDEGRAAMAAEREREVIELPPPPIAVPRRQQVAAQVWAEEEPPRDFPVTVHRGGKDEADRYTYRDRDYRSRDVYLPRGDEDASEEEPDAFD
jgi:hypothetical protein